MSTNLYPATSDTTILEKLAGVPAGTAVDYAAWMAHYPEDDGRFVSEEVQNARQAAFEAWDAAATDNIHRYHTLVDYGFGRVTQATWQLAVKLATRTKEHPATGHATDNNDVAALLATQGVNLPEDVPLPALGGVFWS